MKKIFYLFAILCCCYLQSCVKEYNCTCFYTDQFGDTSSEVISIKNTRSAARKTCESMNSHNSPYYTDATCKFN